MTLEQSLDNARKRWVEARKKDDLTTMTLWCRVGNGIKERIAERMGKQSPVTDTQIENIFGGKLEI